MDSDIVENSHRPLKFIKTKDVISSNFLDYISIKETITFAGSSDSSAQMRTEFGARSGNSRVNGIAPSPRKI